MVLADRAIAGTDGRMLFRPFDHEVIEIVTRAFKVCLGTSELAEIELLWPDVLDEATLRRSNLRLDVRESGSIGI